MLSELGCNPQTSRARFGRLSTGFGLKGGGRSGQALVIHRICRAPARGFHTPTRDAEEVMG